MAVAPSETVTALSAKAATKIFGGLVAVDALSLDLPSGALYGVIGPNGAGKTTAFNLLTGVYPLTSGEVSVFGTSTRGLTVDKIARLGISRTFQTSRLFKNMSCLDNLKVSCHSKVNYTLFSPLFFTRKFVRIEKEIHRHCLELLKLFDLDRFAHQEACSLPYGAQRRLEIARALATGARILLLDEPAAGMNPQEKEELRAWVKKIKDLFQLSILVIEHDMRFVMNLCEKVYVLDHGVLIAQGSPQSIQKDPKVIEAYLGVEDKA